MKNQTSYMGSGSNWPGPIINFGLESDRRDSYFQENQSDPVTAFVLELGWPSHYLSD